MENHPDKGQNIGHQAPEKKEKSSDSSFKKSAETEQTNNRKKVIVNEINTSVITNLPPEVSEMMRAARRANNKTTEGAPEPPQRPSSETEQTHNRKKVVINELTNSVITNLPPELTEMLRAARQANNKKEPTKINLPVSPPPPPEKNNNALIIDETGSIFGIKVNISTRKDVLERMKTISKIGISNPGESIFKYDDLGIVFYFGEGGNLQEITFSYPFAGATSKGLRIEDSIKKAIELYGPPKMKTAAGAIWDKFAVFIKDNLVTTIRLRNS